MVPKPSNGEIEKKPTPFEKKPNPFVKAGDIEKQLPDKEQTDKLGEIPDKEQTDKEQPNKLGEVPDYSEDWKDTSLPSPSTIDFEIQELEKLSVLEPVEYPFKYKMVFKTASLITDLEHSASVIAQKKEGILDIEDARTELGKEDIVNREQLKTRLSEQIMDLIKKYVKPRPEDQMLPFGNKAKELIDTADEVKQFMETGSGNAPMPMQESKDRGGSPLGLSLNKAVSAQGTKKPIVKVDQTSTR
jgi:hypothetical protein